MRYFCSGNVDGFVTLKGAQAVSRVPLRKDLFVKRPFEKTMQP
jgi:hypothetical protein